MKKQDTENREWWLQAAVAEMKPLFKQHGYGVPPVRVSCGWPSRGGCGVRKRTIGQCWDKKAADDRVAQIFISPLLVEKKGEDRSQNVLATLVHEVVHAIVGCKEGHNKVFGKCARAVGLEGKLTQTFAGEALRAEIDKWVSKLGEYPHARLNPGMNPVKKQTTRLLKCACPDCGYNVRVTRKWLDEVGAPLCPCNETAMTPEDK
jgi:hypothetical protein